jgi:hypothetical protein
LRSFGHLDRVKPSQSHIFAKSEKRVAAQTPSRKMINHPSRKWQKMEKNRIFQTRVQQAKVVLRKKTRLEGEPFAELKRGLYE